MGDRKKFRKNKNAHFDSNSVARLSSDMYFGAKYPPVRRASVMFGAHHGTYKNP